MNRFILVLGILTCLSGCSEAQQAVSHVKSSMIGLNRVITLYSADGSVIKQWRGNYKVEYEGGSARFIHQGKAISLSGTYVIEEV